MGIPILRDALRHYVNAKYRLCLNLLNKMRKEIWFLDMYLFPHIDVLWTMIRDKCLIEYLLPFSCVSLLTTKDIFNIKCLEDMEDLIVDLIIQGKIPGAKINDVDKTLNLGSIKELEYAKRDNTRKKVSHIGNKFLMETESMVLRLSCLQNGVMVQDNNTSFVSSSKKSGSYIG